MTVPLTEAYLEWLGSQVRETEMSQLYPDLLRILHEKEFVWQVANDDNRIADGEDLRREFHPGWHWDAPVSVLEVLVGLSRRLAWDAGGEPRMWAWILVQNLGLSHMRGKIGKIRAERIDEILERLIWRTYDRDGSGGFFPLNNPPRDQRKVEIWYQMAAYLMENQEE